MKQEELNGPAFPLPCEDDRDCYGRYESGYAGMTLRDYFAAHAIPAIVADHARGQFPPPNHVAEEAYEIADAMLAERVSPNA